MSALSRLLVGTALFAILSGTAVAGDEKAEAIKKERMRYAGTWQVESAELNGMPLTDEMVKGFKVVNEPDGKWAIEKDGTVIARGTSEIDPTQKVKTVDLTQTEGDAAGQVLLGIYELTDDTRKVCFAQSGAPRPTEFSAPSGSNNLLVVMKKVKKEKK